MAIVNACVSEVASLVSLSNVMFTQVRILKRFLNYYFA